jgi:hypothetical protein
MDPLAMSVTKYCAGQTEVTIKTITVWTRRLFPTEPLSKLEYMSPNSAFPFSVYGRYELI